MPVTTWQNDTHRTGQNLKEGTLVPPLSAINFGQLCNVPLDGQVYAQPLVETNVTISGTGMLYIFGSGRVCQWRDSRGV
ncbi:MAG TPA: hypothetical protein VND65_07690 [Candidatus Binatia bacterium]|nr:hypothetical protein [Candidatus Binatia bacterium]